MASAAGFMYNNGDDEFIQSMPPLSAKLRR
jgi:hypothetical protein